MSTFLANFRLYRLVCLDLCNFGDILFEKSIRVDIQQQKRCASHFQPTTPGFLLWGV